MKRSTSYAWTSIGALAALSMVVVPLVSYYFVFDVNMHIQKYFTVEGVSREDINIIDDSTLKGYPNIKDGIEREEIASQKCINSFQESCIFTVPVTIVRFKVPEIDGVSQTLHLEDCSSPVLGTQLCGIIQYNRNYYGLQAAIPIDKLLASILYGGLATVIGTIVIAFVWVKYGNNMIMKGSDYQNE